MGYSQRYSILPLLALCVLCAGSGSKNCDDLKDCLTCTAAKSWWPDSGCQWCPIDLQCHAYISTVTPCSKSQNVANATKCSLSNPPSQIHLALAGSRKKLSAQKAMSVMWATLGNVSGSCKYGVSPDALTSVALSGPAVQYLEEATHHHGAVMSPLKAGTEYFYQVGADATGWSSMLSFKTEPADHSQAFTMSVFGDLGFEGSAQRPLILPAVDGLVRNWTAQVTRDWLEAHKAEYDMVWHLGDLGYADDGFASSPISFAYEHIYDGWMNWMQTITSTKPYMVSPGNHEAECHSRACGAFISHTAKGKKLSNFTAYNARWTMPYASSGSRSNMWYSYDYSSAHIVSLSSETDFQGNHGKSGRSYPAGGFGPNDEQMKWLAADLEVAHAERLTQGSGMKWIIVGGHRPTSQLSQTHLDLFKKYHVDIYLAGHSHSYTRSSPVNGTTLVVVGGAGCDEMAQAPKDSRARAPADLAALSDPVGQGPWWQEGFNTPAGTEEFSTARYATGLLSVNQSVLHWQLYDSEDGQVLDQFVIRS